MTIKPFHSRGNFMKRKIEPVISDEVKAIRKKLEQDVSGAGLNKAEKKREVSRDEAAYLLSTIAGRVIDAEYIRQLLRGEKPRLTPARAIGNTYLFTVESLVGIRFTKAHEKEGNLASES